MNDSTEVVLARVEGKIDLTNERLSTLTERAGDHEQRIRELEARPAVTPKAFWSGLAVVAAVIGAASPFLAQLYAR